MWEQGHNLVRDVVDFNAEAALIEGELTYEEAQASLAEFFYHNPAFMLEMLAGFHLYPLQEVMLKGWMQHDFNMIVWGRGVGKSFLLAVFVLIWAMFNPRNRIIVISFSFRASRNIIDLAYKFIQESINDKSRCPLFASNFPQNRDWGLTRGTDLWEWILPNGSTIKCLPLGDGTKIRGMRADTLVVDEFAFLPESIVSTILQPFLVSSNNVQEQIKVKQEEDLLIAAGTMTEDQRTILDNAKKVLFSSSACFQFEHMFKRYEEWIKEIQNDGSDPKRPKSLSSYFISRLSYEAAPPGLMDMKVIEDAKKNTSEAVFQREYQAIFTSDSGGYFRASKMAECTVQDGEDSSTMEMRGEKGFEYILAIDSALSGAEDSDHFAMQVLKIVERVTDGKKLPMLVHSYAVAGADLKDHILYFYYILRSFNIVYIATDASQGDQLEFLNSSIQSELFKNAKINLFDIEADFKTDDFSNVLREVKRSYNYTEGRIIHKQQFSSHWQRAANEYMQACFDHRGALFAAHIKANPAASAEAMRLDYSLLRKHSEFEKYTVTDFIEMQDDLVDLTKKECAMIVVKQTETGIQQWGLPQSIRRTTGPNRERKDGYSALLLGIWATKIYLESRTFSVPNGMPDIDYGWAG